MASGIASAPGPSEPGVWRALSEVMQDGDRVFCASSMPIRDLEAFLPSGEADVRFFANRGANGIDGQISTALGVATDGLGRTFAVVGDLAFAHDQGALNLLGERPDFKLIVVDNGGGGIFDFLPVADSIPEQEMERLFTTPSEADPVVLARANGLDVAAPSTIEGLEDSLSGRSQVVVVNTVRAENLELHRGLNASVDSALSTLLESAEESAE